MPPEAIAYAKSMVPILIYYFLLDTFYDNLLPDMCTDTLQKRVNEAE